jgi:hypothetical protein
MDDVVDLAAVIRALEPFVGRWRGRGAGRFPTIGPFEYSEELSIEMEDFYPRLTYEQKTVLHDGTPSHVEMGFFRPMEDGTIELNNVQDNGRVEVLRGRVTGSPSSGDVSLELNSTALCNDPRLIETRRRFSIVDGRFEYEVQMSTTTTAAPQLLRHLGARFERRTE